ncbi:MAG TPA: hypothetical protein VI072_22975 [Polyangiaceae bacterium]
MKILGCIVRLLAPPLCPLMLGACLQEGGPELHPQPQPPEEHEFSRGDTACPDLKATGGHYVSRDPGFCMLADYVCEYGFARMDPACGCGCTGRPPECSAADEAERRYISREPARCAVIDFACAENEELFNDACGCGCVPSC